MCQHWEYLGTCMLTSAVLLCVSIELHMGAVHAMLASIPVYACMLDALHPCTVRAERVQSLLLC